MRGVGGRALKPRSIWEGFAEITHEDRWLPTGLGKSDRPGSEAQATHGREGDVGQSVQWADTRERLCAHQSCHQTPIGLHPGAAEALLEEPYALIAHVRVCGGAGWATIGSTRQATGNSLRSCLAAAAPRA